MVGCSRGVDTEPIEPNMTRFYALILLLLLLPVGIIAWMVLTLYAGIHLLRYIVLGYNRTGESLQSVEEPSEYPKYVNERGEVV